MSDDLPERPRVKAYSPKDIPWSEALSLQEWVVRMVEDGLTKTPEFQAAMQVWGRKKLEEIWREHVKKKGDLK